MGNFSVSGRDVYERLGVIQKYLISGEMTISGLPTDANLRYSECAAIAGKPGEPCARWCNTCKRWIGDGMAVIVTPPGSVASDNNQFPTCPHCGGKIERITT